MTANVKFTDKGLARIQKQLRDLAKFRIEVGFFGDDGSALHPGSTLTVSATAAIQEFGIDDTPERSFMRSAIIMRQAEIAKAYADNTSAMIAGKKTLVESQSEIAKVITKAIRDRLKSAPSWAKPLDTETVEEKGSATPLKQTGTLERALGWRVFRGASEVAKGK